MQTNWYAIRVFNNRIFRIKEEAEQKGAKTYMAVKTVRTPATGTTTGANPETTARSRTVQLAPSLLFVRTTPDALKAFKQDHFTELMIYRRADSTEPAPIPEEEMRMFILVTSATDGSDVDLLSESLLGPDPKVFDFKPGEKVRVTEGPFKGAEGVIKRIKKDRKLLVAVQGVVVVAISNFPARFLERLTPAGPASLNPTLNTTPTRHVPIPDPEI